MRMLANPSYLKTIFYNYSENYFAKICKLLKNFGTDLKKIGRYERATRSPPTLKLLNVTKKEFAIFELICKYLQSINTG